MPFLYYKGQNEEILFNDDIQMKVSFDPVEGKVNDLVYILSIYSSKGEWLGLKPLTSQLHPCPASEMANSRFLHFGTNYIQSCYYNVFSLLKNPEPVFYELYILDGTKLYPVPVRFLEDDRNLDLNPAIQTVLHRRFFMYDNIAGKTVGADQPYILRFVENIKLK
jgi:hypothetical protein